MSKAGITPYANCVFEQPWWLEVVAPGDWDEVFVKEGSEIIARLPFVMRGHKITMPPLTPSLGPWIKPEVFTKRAGNAQYGELKEIIYSLIEQLPNCNSVSLTLDNSIDYLLPFRWLGFSYEPSFSYRLSMSSSLDSIKAGCNKKVRKSIKRYSEEGHIEMEVDSDILVYIMEKTFAHQNRKYPYSEKLVRSIVEASLLHDGGAMFTAYDADDNIQATSFLIYDDKVAYALIGGSDPEYRGQHSKTAVYWKEIEYTHEHSDYFDFEGSNIEGIEHLFRQFGGVPVTNYCIAKRTLFGDCLAAAKPHIKRMIGYKI